MTCSCSTGRNTTRSRGHGGRWRPVIQAARTADFRSCAIVPEPRQSASGQRVLAVASNCSAQSCLIRHGRCCEPVVPAADRRRGPRRVTTLGGRHCQLNSRSHTDRYSKKVGAVGLEPTNPSLVRRNTARNTPTSPGRLMHLNCENHARKCPKVPGVVCTVVPASGSRSRFPPGAPRWLTAGGMLARAAAVPPVR